MENVQQTNTINSSVWSLYRGNPSARKISRD